MEEKKYIQLNNSDDVLTLWIKTKEGKETGECLTFDMEDIDLLDNLEKMRTESIKNHNWVNSQLAIIGKKEDFTKKGEAISNNTRETYRVLKSYFKRQKEIFDIFLGKGGVDKLLYGRKFEWGTLQEITEIIEKQIVPLIKQTTDNIVDKVKKKYNYKNLEESNVLE